MIELFERFKAKRDEGGFTLIELAFVVGIIALIIILVLRFYTQTKRAHDVNHATEDMTFIMAGIKDWKVGSADYTGLTLTGLYNQGRVPDDIINKGGTYALPSWDGCAESTVSFAGTPGTNVEIDFNKISSRLCLSLQQRLNKNVSTLIDQTIPPVCIAGPVGGCTSVFKLTMS